VTPDRSSAHHGRGGTVGGGGNCAVDTEVSKQSDVGRNETMVGSSKVVVGHIDRVNALKNIWFVLPTSIKFVRNPKRF